MKDLRYGHFTVPFLNGVISAHYSLEFIPPYYGDGEYAPCGFHGKKGSVTVEIRSPDRAQPFIGNISYAHVALILLGNRWVAESSPCDFFGDSKGVTRDRRIIEREHLPPYKIRLNLLRIVTEAWRRFTEVRGNPVDRYILSRLQYSLRHRKRDLAEVTSIIRRLNRELKRMRTRA